MFFRTICATLSSCSCASFFSSGVIDDISEPGRASQRSTIRRMRSTHTSASALVAFSGSPLIRDVICAAVISSLRSDHAHHSHRTDPSQPKLITARVFHDALARGYGFVTVAISCTVSWPEVIVHPVLAACMERPRERSRKACTVRTETVAHGVTGSAHRRSRKRFVSCVRTTTNSIGEVRGHGFATVTISRAGSNSQTGSAVWRLRARTGVRSAPQSDRYGFMTATVSCTGRDHFAVRLCATGTRRQCPCRVPESSEGNRPVYLPKHCLGETHVPLSCFETLQRNHFRLCTNCAMHAIS